MNLYKVLGVPATASQEEIKASFRKLALQHHPDRGIRERQIARGSKVPEAQRIKYDYQQRSPASWQPRTHSHVNRDWSRQYYEYPTAGEEYTSRMGWWERLRRMTRSQFRGADLAVQGALVVMLGGGVLFVTVGSDAIWEARNQGKQFKDLPPKMRPMHRSSTAPVWAPTQQQQTSTQLPQPSTPQPWHPAQTGQQSNQQASQQQQQQQP